MSLEISEIILTTIDRLIDGKLRNFKYNHMVSGLITEVISDSTYKVRIQDNIETIKSMNNDTYQVGDVVYVVVWNNNYSDKTIVCKATK